MYSGLPRRIIEKKKCDLCETEDRTGQSRLCYDCREKWMEYEEKYRRLYTTKKPTREIFEKWLEKMKRPHEAFVFR